jgi:hypothetical protein
VFGSNDHSYTPNPKYVQDENLKDYYFFSFVRNPWDRFLSVYLFLRGGGLNEHDRYIERTLIKGRDFEEFILDTPVRDLLSYPYFCRYIYFLDRLKRIDYVGRYENLNEDFKQILINLKEDEIELPHINSNNNKKHYTEYYNDKTIAAIGKLYHNDIRDWDYKFGK